tara:strand:+ start:9641 stop:9799 length:159 start_codon:yes stop_codon:yes gene_type:complete
MNKKAINRNGTATSRANYPKLKGKELTKAINEVHKDPKFMAEIKKFIKVTTS